MVAAGAREHRPRKGHDVNDIRKGTDVEIRQEIGRVLGTAAPDVIVARSILGDRASHVLSLEISDVESITFLQLTELAGACGTPDIAITTSGTHIDADETPPLELTVTWQTPLVAPGAEFSSAT